MPVLPAVPSTITPPGWSVPRSSASRTMNSAARSLTEPPGLRNSALPRIVQPVSSEARRSLMSGVLPIVPRKPSRTCMAISAGLEQALSGAQTSHRAGADQADAAAIDGSPWPIPHSGIRACTAHGSRGGDPMRHSKRTLAAMLLGSAAIVLAAVGAAYADTPKDTVVMAKQIDDII